VAEGPAVRAHLNLAALVVHYRCRVFHDANIQAAGLGRKENKMSCRGG
jgi:hypothetical protein